VPGGCVFVRDESPLLRLRDLIDPVARRAGMTAGADTGIVWRRWSDIVGIDVARHAEPSSLRNGLLRVRTDSPAWATELSYMTAELRTRVNEVFGKEIVHEVRVWTSSEPVRPPQPARRRSDSATVTAGSADPLEAFERAHRTWQRRRSERRS
jgi:predicted nucleic acid-binding Zn ribbon protein